MRRMEGVNKSDESGQHHENRPQRRRRAPFKASGIGCTNNDQIRSISSCRNTPTSTSASAAIAEHTQHHRRSSRLFSARIFSASKARFPFNNKNDDDVEDLDVEEQKPSTSQEKETEEKMGNRQFCMKPFSMMPQARRRAAHLAETLGEGNEQEEEGEEEIEEKRKMNEIVEIIEDEPQTINELSDIEDIELGGDFDFAIHQNDGPSISTVPSHQIEEIRAKTAHERRRRQMHRPNGNNVSLDESGGSWLDLAQPRLPQSRRFQRKRPKMELLTFSGEQMDEKEEANLARLEEGKMMEGKSELRPPKKEERAFSPALDIELAPSATAEGAIEPTSRKKSRGSIKSMVASVLSPRRAISPATIPSGLTSNSQQVENVVVDMEEEIRRKNTQNGSIGGIPSTSAHPVPSPPLITISSPREKPPKSSSGIPTSVDSEAANTTTNQANQIQPSLIKGLSKSISRFRSRNRVLNAEALEQANFMSKFGMSGGGIRSSPIGFPEKSTVTPNGGSGRRKGRLTSLVFDTNENYFYFWIAIVSTAYVYNLLVVIARSVFVDLAGGRLWMLWLAMDLLMDSIYAADMFVRSRTGYLEQGLLVRDCAKIRALYLRSRHFFWDTASMLPFDYLYWLISRKPQPILRINRLLRKDRIQRFMEQTETRTSMPNAFRVGVVVWYIAVIIHWNACFYFFISEWIGLGSDPWVYGLLNKQSLPEGINDTLTRRYIYSFYWSTLILTTIGEVPGPQQNVEYAFVTVDLMCGVLIFATIVGNVGSMISNISAGRTDFQNRIDSIKQYMDLRSVGKQLEVRVIKWFDYLWANKQGLTDAKVLKVLPDKLQAEIAMHVHFETLRKVRIFQDCEAGLLAELVLKLQLQVFSPGDYVCRKGDIGREMYIVKRGMLQVVADDGLKVLATLSEGAVFGELSILNIAGSKNGNRRTANVRSVGYTDLFVLNKNDLWIALREYPEARKILINKGRELLRKDNLLDESVPEEQKTAEELSEELQSSVRILQIRIARLMAEQTNSETKLRARIGYLEGKLQKYADLSEEIGH